MCSGRGTGRSPQRLDSGSGRATGGTLGQRLGGCSSTAPRTGTQLSLQARCPGHGAQRVCGEQERPRGEGPAGLSPSSLSGNPDADEGGDKTRPRKRGNPPGPNPNGGVCMSTHGALSLTGTSGLCPLKASGRDAQPESSEPRYHQKVFTFHPGCQPPEKR